MAATTIGSTVTTRDTSSGGRCLSSLGGGLPFGSSFGLGPGGGGVFGGSISLSFGGSCVFFGGWITGRFSPPFGGGCTEAVTFGSGGGGGALTFSACCTASLGGANSIF